MLQITVTSIGFQEKLTHTTVLANSYYIIYYVLLFIYTAFVYRDKWGFQCLRKCGAEMHNGDRQRRTDNSVTSSSVDVWHVMSVLFRLHRKGKFLPESNNINITRKTAEGDLPNRWSTLEIKDHSSQNAAGMSPVFIQDNPLCIFEKI